jgi:Rho-binding antiterminator
VTEETEYTPIACGVHDRLESWAVRGDTVEVVWHDGADERRQRARITDVVARNGADWVVLETGETIRADRLSSVGGVAVIPAC